jgi:hypothetical protein
MSSSERKERTDCRKKWWIASGLFLVVLSIYVLTSPGRIDITDGQQRYEVAYNWLVEGRPVFRDPWLKELSVPGRDGLRYSLYGAPASIFSMPLVWSGVRIEDSSRETSRFLFSLTTPIFGAAIAFILFLFYVELGLELRSALLWTMVSAFTTLIWPASCTTFENAQRAFFAIAASYLGFLSAKRKSNLLAVAGGLVAAVLLLYQEYHIFIIPLLAISTLDWARNQSSAGSARELASSAWTRLVLGVHRSLDAQVAFIRAAIRGEGEERASCVRFLLWSLTAVLVGLTLSFSYNYLRFGSFVKSGRMERSSPVTYMANPLAGLSTLLISPGKGILLYSPPLVLGILGLRGLRRTRPELAYAILTASLMLISMLSYISFVGGDWCWGPRYLVVLLPLWALPLPFVFTGRMIRRNLVVALVGTGLFVQVLALGVENQRFFFDRGLEDTFYLDDPWVYFKHSALFARVAETVSLQAGPPLSAQFFNSVPIPRWSTYCILGPPGRIPRSLAPEWMRSFKIYYLPRPWPFWMWSIKPVLRPINIGKWITGLAGVLLVGIAFVCCGFRKRVTASVRQARELRLDISLTQH